MSEVQGGFGRASGGQESGATTTAPGLSARAATTCAAPASRAAIAERRAVCDAQSRDHSLVATTGPAAAAAADGWSVCRFRGARHRLLHQAPTLNPYASPAEAYLSQTGFAAAGPRPGLPWEVEGPGVMSWWKTAQMCLTDASHAFRLMRQEGGIGSPLLYAALGLLLGFVGQTIWRIPLLLLEIGGGGGNNGWPQGVNGALWEVGISAVISLGIATFGLFFFAALYHACLLALGGARHGYETTYRVVAFTHGSIAWLQVVPCVGGCIVLVMLYICLINGLAAAQETTGGKAAAAVFIPLGFFVLLGAVALVGIVAVAIALDG